MAPLHFISKTIMLAAIMMISVTAIAAQAVTAGKYNITNYPEDRKAIALLNTVGDSSKHFNDDYISVGAEGRVYYGRQAEETSFNKFGLSFKSVTPVPGTEILRVYNGSGAVHCITFDVVFSSPKGDMYVKVIRSTTYAKITGKWYVVFGQGTVVQTEAELEESMQRALKKH